MLKLATELRFLTEKFNGATAFIGSPQTSLKLNGVEKIYTVNADRASATKALVLISNGKARIFEIDLRLYVTSSIGFNNEVSVVNFMGSNIDVDYFYKNIEQNFKMAVNRYSGYDDERAKKIFRRFGTAKTSGDTNWIPYEEAAKKLLDYGFTEAKIKKIAEFQNVDLKSAEGVEKIGNFYVFGFSPKTEGLKKQLKDAASLTEKAGFKDLVYGNFYLLPKAGAQTLADYNPHTDDIRAFESSLRTGGKRNLIHELGHRFYYRFTSDKGRREIENKFYEVMRAAKESVKEKGKSHLVIGNKYVIGGKPTVYDGYTLKQPNGRKLVHKFPIVDAEGKKTGRFYFYDKEEDAIMAVVPETKKGFFDNPYLPSEYSRTNSTEWFAEVFSFAIENDNKDVIEWVKTLRK